MKSLKRLIHIAAAIAILSFTAHTAPGGGKGQPKATLTFDDLAGDAIQSDGLGSYEVAFEQGGDRTVISMGKEALFFDFSDCDHTANLSCESPLGAETDTGYVKGVTLTLYGLQGEPNSSGSAQAFFEFSVQKGKWRLGCSITVFRVDDDEDGMPDRFVLEDTGEASANLEKFFSSRTPFSGQDWRVHGRFFMPWGATLQLP